jgi:cyclomaltodextrinase
VEEFIFGTLATDELKLVHHRAARRGVHHRHELTPRDPQPDQPVTVTVTIGPDLSVDGAACYYTTGDDEPTGSRGSASCGHGLPLEKAGLVWDTLSWGYLSRWQTTLPAQPAGTTVRYRISAWDAGREIWADWPEVDLAAEQAAAAFFRGEPLPEAPPGDPAHGRTFAYGVDHLAPPDWARRAVIYQIFVDRFYPGLGQDWRQTTDLRGFCGGTLWGVAEKLDYVAALGADCIWLTPIFVSQTHHGYDATDLTRVEPRLGGDEALAVVVREAHARGIRVLLDLVCNHVSHRHPVFGAAAADPAGPYRNWFFFDESAVGYRSFFGTPTMPKVNLGHPAARRWMIDTALTWLRDFDIDGYRLDHANGPGPDFWTDFWTACKAVKPDCFCFGEIVDAPDTQRAYVGRLDGVLDFHTGDALRRTYALGAWSEAQLARFLERHLAFFPADFLLPTFIDNHDMDRFLRLAGGNKEALRRAATAQMRLPGPPIVYYGTEVGLTQTAGTTEGLGLHVNRVPMIWGAEQDRDLLAFYRSLISERRTAEEG